MTATFAPAGGFRIEVSLKCDAWAVGGITIWPVAGRAASRARAEAASRQFTEEERIYCPYFRRSCVQIALWVRFSQPQPGHGTLKRRPEWTYALPSNRGNPASHS